MNKQSETRPKVLFISHSYPPIVGGVENQNKDLSTGLEKITQTKIIANGKGKKFLIFFLPVAFLKAFFMMTKYDVCLMGNGVLSPLAAILKFFHPKKRFFCVVHGLDITYSQKKGLLPSIYKHINIPSLKKLDKIFMVSNATIEEAKKVGIEKERCIFIPNGVHVDKIREKHTREELSKLFGSDVSKKKVILRLARFVPHKGTDWFIENVFPKLNSDTVMIAAGNRVAKKTAGDEDNFIKCEKIICEKKLQKRVKLLPSIPWSDVKKLLNTVDLVVAPNVKIKGSMEGFGINAIEAGACQRVLIASNIEGLSDAVKNGKNGFLVESKNTEQWIEKITAILNSGENFQKKFGKEASQYITENYNWEKICEKYLTEMEK